MGRFLELIHSSVESKDNIEITWLDNMQYDLNRLHD